MLVHTLLLLLACDMTAPVGVGVGVPTADGPPQRCKSCAAGFGYICWVWRASSRAVSSDRRRVPVGGTPTNIPEHLEIDRVGQCYEGNWSQLRPVIHGGLGRMLFFCSAE